MAFLDVSKACDSLVRWDVEENAAVWGRGEVCLHL